MGIRKRLKASNVTRTRWLVTAGGALAILMGACAPTYYNNTTTLGGSVPGGRSNINVMFINNTPYRALFTFGTFDTQNIPSLDPAPLAFTPEFDQFFASNDATQRLEGNTSSDVFTFTCGRAMSIGGQQLIQIMTDENLTAELDESALTPGIGFSDAPLDSDNADQATAGRGAETVTLQGAEYQCDSLLVYKFSVDTAREECLGDTPIPDDCFITELEVLLP